MLKLCISADFIRRREDGSVIPFAESTALAKELGFEEFDMELGRRFFLQENWREEIDRRAETVAKAGMKIRTLHLPFDYPAGDDAEGWEQFRQASRFAIDAGVDLGVDCAAIHPCTGAKADYDHDQEYADAKAFLLPYCEYAKKAGLPLAIENMRSPGWSAPARLRRFGTDVDDLIRLADDLEEGICWDTGHGHISLQNQYKSIVKIGHRLRMVHLDDNYGEDDIHIAPFLGSVDWQGVVRGLKEIGFTGALNQELGCRGKSDDMQRAYASYLAAAGKKLLAMYEACEI